MDETRKPSPMRRRSIGLVSGLGPLAGADVLRKLLEHAAKVHRSSCLTATSSSSNPGLMLNSTRAPSSSRSSRRLPHRPRPATRTTCSSRHRRPASTASTATNSAIAAFGSAKSTRQTKQRSIGSSISSWPSGSTTPAPQSASFSPVTPGIITTRASLPAAPSCPLRLTTLRPYLQARSSSPTVRWQTRWSTPAFKSSAVRPQQFPYHLRSGDGRPSAGDLALGSPGQDAPAGDHL
jgi:hypothetical protein